MDRPALTHEKRQLESQIADLRLVLNGDNDPELTPQLESAEKRMAEIDSELAKPLVVPPFVRSAPKTPGADQTLRAFLLQGTPAFTTDDARLLNRRGIAGGSIESRAGLMTSTTTGSYAREESSLLPGFEKILREYSDYAKFARLVSTDSGEPLRIAIDNDDAKGAIIAETVADAENEVTLDLRTVEVAQYTSGICLLSYEILRDQKIGIETLVSEALALRVARVIGEKFTNGTGTAGEPKGLLKYVDDAGAGTAKIPSVATAGTGGLSLQDLIATYAGLPSHVQANPNTRWFLSPAAYQSFLHMADSTGRPMGFEFGSSATGNPLGTICGKAISVLPDLEGVSTGKVCGLIGDPSQLVFRMVGNYEIQKNESYYWKTRQIGIRVLFRAGFSVLSGDSFRAIKVK